MEAGVSMPPSLEHVLEGLFGRYVSSEFEPWKPQWGANQARSVKNCHPLGPIRLYKRDLSAMSATELLSRRRTRAYLRKAGVQV